MNSLTPSHNSLDCKNCKLIIMHLQKEPNSATGIALKVDVIQATLHRHMKLLLKCGKIKRESYRISNGGKEIIYRTLEK